MSGNRIFKGVSLNEKINNYTVIDLETTSRYVNDCEVIELAAVKIENNKIIDTYETLVQPSDILPPAIINVTGITNEMLVHAPQIQDVIQEYIDFIGDDIVVGHNINAFDCNIIYDLCEAFGLKHFSNDFVDTLHFAQKCDIAVPDYKLTTIAEYFGIEYDAHRAKNDCIANYQCYELLKNKYVGRHKETNTKTYEQKLSLDLIKEEYNNISGKNIVLTGDFKTGGRNEIKLFLEENGAFVKNSVSGKTNFIIIGAYGSKEWKFGTYGGKVDKALELQAKGKDVKIIKEEEFFKCLKETV